MVFFLDSGFLAKKSQVRYDSFFPKADIGDCLTRLREAIDLALSTGGCLVFYGD